MREPERDVHRQNAENFRRVWREWREDKSREQCEAMVVEMIEGRSPWCAAIARADLDADDPGDEGLNAP